MINVIGLGYIGLPTALMMASHGVEVIGTDYNKQLVDTLNAGHTTFKEDGLDELLRAPLRLVSNSPQSTKRQICILCLFLPHMTSSQRKLTLVM